MSAVDERLQTNIDKFLALVLKKRSNRIHLIKLPIEVFKDETNILVTLLNTFRGKDVILDNDFIKIYLSRNPKIILENPNVDKNILNEFDSYPLEEFIKLTLNKFNELKALDIDDLEDSEDEENDNGTTVETLLTSIIEDYKYLELMRTIDISKEIALEGYSVGRKNLIGVEDASDYLKTNMLKIEALSKGEKYQPATSAKDDYEASKLQVQNDSEMVSDFGDVSVLNEAYNGGLRTGYFYNILGPPKAGKSKFCSRLLHTALVKYGVNCFSLVLEGGGKDKQLSELRAIHFDYFYRKLGHDLGTSILSPQEIKDNLYPSQEIKLLEERSYLDFLYNEEYGTLIQPPNDFEFHIDTFEAYIESEVLKHDIKFVLIDYLTMINFDVKVMPMHQAIGSTYKKSLRLAVKLNIAFVSPSQMTGDFIDSATRASDLEKLDTRIAAGGSLEVTKSPDANIALYATQTDIREGTVYLLPYLSRIGKPYKLTKLYVDLNTDYFSTINE